MDDGLDIRSVFLEEAADLCERIHDCLSGFLEAADQPERFKELLRALHTLKGGAGTVELHELKELAHGLETFLLDFTGKEASVDATVLAEVAKAMDAMERCLEGGETVAGQETSQESASSGLQLFEAEDESVAPTVKPVEQAAKPTPTSSQEMIRVPLERIERNFDFISEIFMTRNQMRFLVERFVSGSCSSEDFLTSWEGLDNSLRKSIGELEYIAMSMRMMPIKSLFHRMEKTVRSYLGDSKKRIQVRFLGESTEVDKKILDGLAEPLIHLVRNGMDHGIEECQQRKELGKSEEATLILSAELVANEIVVKVQDDGRGIDHEKLLQSARSKGMDTSWVKTSDDALRLILQPGFSTKQEVSDISGRGIGMDAVNSYVTNLGGSMDIATEVGRGSVFTLRLPLGMSVIPALLASCNQQLFAVATGDVQETLKVPASSIIKNGDDDFLKYKDRFIPCYDLENFLYGEGSRVQATAATERVALAIIQHNSEQIALRMGSLEDNLEIVAKPLASPSPQLGYVTGVTILVTGEPTFVISLSKLYEQQIYGRQREESRVAA